MSLGLTLPPIADWMMLALTSHYTATNAKHHRYAATSLRTVSGAGGWRGRRGGERLGRGGSGRPGSGRPGSGRRGRHGAPLGKGPVGGGGMGLRWGRVRSAGAAWARWAVRVGVASIARGGVGRLVEDGPLGPGRRRVGAGALGHLSRQGRSADRAGAAAWILWADRTDWAGDRLRVGGSRGTDTGGGSLGEPPKQTGQRTGHGRV
jgi:hypothetical protein